MLEYDQLAPGVNRAGFAVASYLPQAQFLIGTGLQEVYAQTLAQGAGEHASYQLAQQVKRLMLPDQMGERFQAMLLARGLESLPLPAELLAADQGGRL